MISAGSFIGGGFSTISPFLLTFAAIAKSDSIQNTVHGVDIGIPLCIHCRYKVRSTIKTNEFPTRSSNLFVLAGSAAYSGSAHTSSNSSRFRGDLTAIKSSYFQQRVRNVFLARL